MKKVELLAPAGNLEKLKIAVDFGADAVYLGGQKYGLRSSSDNFTIEEINEGVQYAKKQNVKVFVTTNIFAHTSDVVGFQEYIQTLESIGVTGIIVADPAFILIAKKYAPKLEIHISTQQTITNSSSIEAFKALGADRVVLGRELTIEEITEIVHNTQNCSIEIFLHGAVCSSYSGRCTISNHLTLRDSNRGGCCQSCRWPFEIYERKNGIFTKSEVNDINNPFSMSSKDLVTLDNLPNIIESGVDSLKIEGRMKSIHYLATVVKVYRIMIDSYYENPNNFILKKEWVEELQKAETRPADTGALASNFGTSSQIFGNQYQEKSYTYCGIVLEYDEKNSRVLVEQRNFFKVGDEIEFFSKKFDNYTQILGKIYNEDFIEIEKANHPLMHVWLPVNQKMKKNYILRRKLGDQNEK